MCTAEEVSLYFDLGLIRGKKTTKNKLLLWCWCPTASELLRAEQVDLAQKLDVDAVLYLCSRVASCCGICGSLLS